MDFGLHMWVKRLAKIFQWCWWTAGSLAIIVVLLLAVLLNVARLATPWLNKHPERVQQQIESVWPGKVQFKTMHWSWSWLSPQVVLSDVTVAQKSKLDGVPESLHIDRMSLSLNLLQTLTHWHLHLNGVDAQGTQIIVRQQRDGYLVNGFFIAKHHSQKPMTIESILKSFSAIKVSHIQLNQIQVSLYLLQHDPIHIQLQNLAVLQDEPRVSMHGMLSISPDHVQSMQFWIKEDSSSHLGKACIQVVNAHVQQLQQWAFTLPLLKRLNSSWQDLYKLDAHANGTVWLSLKDDQVTKMQAKLSVSQISLQDADPNHFIYMGGISANMAFVRSHLHWSFLVNQLEGTKADRVYSLGDFLLSYRGGALAQRQWQLYANHLNLAMFSRPMWVHFLAGFHKAKAWAQLYPHGYVDFIHASVSNLNPKQTSQMHFQIQAFLHHVSWQAVGHLPGVSYLNGVIAGSEKSGQVQLSQDVGAIDFKGLFKYPWMIKQSAVDGDWSYSAKDKHWVFSLSKLLINDGHLNLQTSGTLDGLGKQVPNADLHGNFSLNDVSYLQHYLPLVKLKPKVYNWLTDSLQQGFLNNGELIIQGPLKHFPFKHHEGKFIASGDIHQVHFKFDPNWPALNDLQGYLLFQNDGMQVQNAQADLPFIQLKQINAKIPHFHNADLDVSSQMSGDLKGVDQFILQTPLSIAKLFKDLKGAGGFAGGLHLNLPLSHLSDQTKVDGFVTMQDATWRAPAWNTLMTQTHGTVHFTETGVTADDLNGLLFNAPTHITMQQVMQPGLKKPAVGVHLSGDYSLSLLVKTYVPPLTPFVAGSAPVSLNLIAYGADAHKDDELELHSDLVGASILHFPDGLSKAAKQKTPYHLTMDIGDKRTVINSQYGSQVKAHTVLAPNKQGDQAVVSTHVMIGGEKIPDDMNKGLAISFNKKHSDLDVWYRLYEKYVVHNASTVKNPLVLSYLSAQVGSGVLFNQDLTGIQYEMRRSGDEWDWRLVSSRVSGDGNLPIGSESKKPWEIRLKQAHLRQIKVPHSVASNLPVKYSDFPAMQFSANDISYVNYNLHHLKFTLSHPNDSELFLDHIYIGDKALNATTNIHGMHLTSKDPFWHMTGSVQGDNFGSGLTELGLPVHLASTSGRIKLDAYIHHQWPVGKWSDIASSISANASVALVNGSIIDLSPSLQSTLGALKILNTLSIQALPEKLAGKNRNGNLYFTSLKGSGSLNQMLWQVPQLTLKSTELQAAGSGFGRLDDKSVSFWVRVQPHLTGSVPVIAAFAGGPVVGIASWFVNKLFVSPVVSSAAEKSFHIFGKWPNIKVISPHKNKTQAHANRYS